MVDLARSPRSLAVAAAPAAPRAVAPFAIAFAALIMGPPCLGGALLGYPLVTVGDAIDLITPAVLLPLYAWLLLESRGVPDVRTRLAFLMVAAVWIEGQGMHLGANSIARHVSRDVSPDLQTIVHFYDETLGHLLWHTATMALSALCVAAPRERREPCALLAPIACGVLYGFTFFCMVTEGTTTALGVPFAVGAAAWLGRRGGPALRRQPVPLFFLSGYTFASLCFLVWGIWWGGRLPEFSEVGLL